MNNFVVKLSDGHEDVDGGAVCDFVVCWRGDSLVGRVRRMRGR